MTSGIDFALTVAAEILGAGVAQEFQLQMEYDPQPPYQAGSPRSASHALVNKAREKIEPVIAQRRTVTERVAR